MLSLSILDYVFLLLNLSAYTRRRRKQALYHDMTCWSLFIPLEILLITDPVIRLLSCEMPSLFQL